MSDLRSAAPGNPARRAPFAISNSNPIPIRFDITAVRRATDDSMLLALARLRVKR